MTGFFGFASIIVLMTAITACSGGGYGAAPHAGNSGGAYGGGGNAGGAQPGTARPSVAEAPSVASTTASAGTGRGRYDYGSATTGPGAAASGAGASPKPAGASAPSGTVLLSGFAFNPTAVTVAAGSEIAFSNKDSVGHVLVDGEDGTPASASAAKSPVGPGQMVNLPFPKAGAFKITCTIHPSMNLTVTVTP